MRLLQSVFERRDNLSVEVIDRRGEEEQGADRPTNISDVPLDSEGGIGGAQDACPSRLGRRHIRL
jgi:hypothetical protein